MKSRVYIAPHYPPKRFKEKSMLKKNVGIIGMIGMIVAGLIGLVGAFAMAKKKK